MPPDDETRLRHMLSEAARKAIEFVAGKRMMTLTLPAARSRPAAMSNWRGAVATDQAVE